MKETWNQFVNGGFSEVSHPSLWHALSFTSKGGVRIASGELLGSTKSNASTFASAWNNLFPIGMQEAFIPNVPPGQTTLIQSEADPVVLELIYLLENRLAILEENFKLVSSESDYASARSTTQKRLEKWKLGADFSVEFDHSAQLIRSELNTALHLSLIASDSPPFVKSLKNKLRAALGATRYLLALHPMQYYEISRIWAPMVLADRLPPAASQQLPQNDSQIEKFADIARLQLMGIVAVETQSYDPRWVDQEIRAFNRVRLRVQAFAQRLDSDILSTMDVRAQLIEQGVEKNHITLFSSPARQRSLDGQGQSLTPNSIELYGKTITKSDALEVYAIYVAAEEGFSSSLNVNDRAVAFAYLRANQVRIGINSFISLTHENLDVPKSQATADEQEMLRYVETIGNDSIPKLARSVASRLTPSFTFNPFLVPAESENTEQHSALYDEISELGYGNWMHADLYTPVREYLIPLDAKFEGTVVGIGVGNTGETKYLAARFDEVVAFDHSQVVGGYNQSLATWLEFANESLPPNQQYGKVTVQLGDANQDPFGTNRARVLAMNLMGFLDTSKRADFVHRTAAALRVGGIASISVQKPEGQQYEQNIATSSSLDGTTVVFQATDSATYAKHYFTEQELTGLIKSAAQTGEIWRALDRAMFDLKTLEPIAPLSTTPNGTREYAWIIEEKGTDLDPSMTTPRLIIHIAHPLRPKTGKTSDHEPGLLC